MPGVELNIYGLLNDDGELVAKGTVDELSEKIGVVKATIRSDYVYGRKVLRKYNVTLLEDNETDSVQTKTYKIRKWIYTVKKDGVVVFKGDMNEFQKFFHTSKRPYNISRGQYDEEFAEYEITREHPEVTETKIKRHISKNDDKLNYFIKHLNEPYKTQYGDYRTVSVENPSRYVEALKQHGIEIEYTHIKSSAFEESGKPFRENYYLVRRINYE